MGTPLQTVIPAALAFLVAYQGGLTRTSRLRSTIRANVELLDKLPAGHPSREALTAHIEELVNTLIRRQRRRFEPITRAGMSFGANVTGAMVALLGVVVMVLEATGVREPEPLTRQDMQWALAFYAGLAVCFAVFAFKAWRRQQREHPSTVGH
jgi:hypothetical protein